VLYSWLRWRFSLGRFFARSTVGGIRTIIIRSRRQNTSGCPSIARAIQHWRKPAACRHFAPKNSLHPRLDLERIINGCQLVNLASTRVGLFTRLLKSACFSGENDILKAVF
jgi:hypothetical protein